MKNQIKIILISLIVVGFTGCNIQKRKHMDGWSIQWHKPIHKQKNKELNQNVEVKEKLVVSASNEEEELVSSVKLKDENFKTVKKKFSWVKIQKINKDLSIEKKSIIAHHEVKEVQKENIRERKKGNYLLYSLTGFLGFGALAGIRLGRKRVTKLTRWSKKNRKKTWWLIGGIQAVLSGISLYSGFNLHKMGFSISDAPMYIGACLMGGAMASMPYRIKREQFTLPKTLKKKRLAFLTATLASSMMMFSIGNKVPESNPESIVVQSLEKVDQSLFSNVNQDLDSEEDLDSEAESQGNRRGTSEDRTAVNFLLAFLSVLGIIVLLATFCAGICIALLAAGEAFAVIGGVAIAGLSVWGIAAIIMAWIRRVKRSRV